MQDVGWKPGRHENNIVERLRMRGPEIDMILTIGCVTWGGDWALVIWVRQVDFTTSLKWWGS